MHHVHHARRPRKLTHAQRLAWRMGTPPGKQTRPAASTPPAEPGGRVFIALAVFAAGVLVGWLIFGAPV